MMDDHILSADLQQLERNLFDRALPEASDDLRQRVLAQVQTVRQQRRCSRWQFAMAVAASALLWLNLSFSATQATDFGLEPRDTDDSISAMAVEIHSLVPEWTAEEVRREAFLLRAASRIVPCPEVPAGYRPYRLEI